MLEEESLLSCRQIWQKIGYKSQPIITKYLSEDCFDKFRVVVGNKIKYKYCSELRTKLSELVKVKRRKF